MEYSHTVPHRQPRLRFVVETPTGPSRYNARLSNEDKRKLKRTLRTLHATGASRKDMLLQCQATIRKPMTYAQLDNIRQELGLQYYRKRPSGSARQPVVNNSSSMSRKPVQECHGADSDEDMDSRSDSEPKGISVVDPSSNNSETVAEEIYAASFNDHMDIDSDGTKARINAPSASMRLLNGTPPELHVFSQEDSMSDDVTTSDHDPETPTNIVDCGESVTAAMGNNATTEYAVEPEGDVTLEFAAADSHLIDDMISSLQVKKEHPRFMQRLQPLYELEEGAATPHRSTSPDADAPGGTRMAPFQLRYDAVLSDPEAWLDEAQFAARVTGYLPAYEALDLYTMAMAQPQGQPANIAMINKAANALFIMKAFDEAFDLYLLIYQGFRNYGNKRDPPHPEMVLAAINCARSAHDVLHIEIGSAIIEMTRQRLRQYYGFDSIKFTETWRYLTALQCELPGCQTRSFSRVYSRWIYWVTLQSRRQMMDAGARFSRTFIVSETERQKDMAYWGAMALMVGQNNPESSPEIVPDYYLDSWRDRALQHFCECEVTKLSILSALARLGSFIREHSDSIDRLFRSYRIPTGHGAGQFAQALTCLFLSAHAHDDPIYNRRQNAQSGHYGFPCDFHGHLTAILPFALADWIEGRRHSRLSLFTRGPRLRIAGQFQLAIKHFTQNIYSTLDYEEMVYSIIDRLGPAKDKHEKRLEGAPIPRDALRGTATGIAGLTPAPNLNWVTMMIATQSTPDGVPETIPESSEISTQGTRVEMATSILSTLAPSIRSSGSSGFQSFKSAAFRFKHGSVSTHNSQSTGHLSSRSSQSFGKVTGIAAIPDSPRRSFNSGSSDVSITSWGPAGQDTAG